MTEKMPSETPRPPHISAGQQAHTFDTPKPKAIPKQWDLPGFHGKAKVFTSFGEMPLEGLRLRDPVKTSSGAFREVVWIDKIHLDEEFLAGFPEAYPIWIRRGAVAPNSPKTDIYLSPGQTVGVSQGWGKQVFKLASELTNRPNISKSPTTQITYYLFHCGHPEEVLIDGMWCSTRP